MTFTNVQNNNICSAAFAHPIGRSHTISELFEKLGGELVIFIVWNDMYNLVELHGEPSFNIPLQEAFAHIGMRDDNEGTNCSMALLIKCTTVVGRVPASA